MKKIDGLSDEFAEIKREIKDDGRPIMPAGVNSFLKNIVNAYNKKESKLAEEEKREPELMPPISSHTLRHTGCTRLGENNVNPKVMQYVMGCCMSSGHPFSIC